MSTNAQDPKKLSGHSQDMSPSDNLSDAKSGKDAHIVATGNQDQFNADTAGQPTGASQQGTMNESTSKQRAAKEDMVVTANTADKKRSRHARSQIVVFANFILSIIVLCAIAASVLFYIGKTQFEAEGTQKEDSVFLVKRGTNIGEIADSLERRELISDGRVFRFAAKAYGYENEMKAGEYLIPADASMRDIMNLLRSGKSIVYQLTVPEGLTVKQIFDRIQDNEILTGELPADLPAEGTLFTDTLHFTRGTTRGELVDRMQSAQKQMIDTIWAGRDQNLPVQNINEFVTLASIVEKETGVASERPHVASVFINRLNKSMRLQSDPTIIYGLFGGNGKPSDRPIFKSDIEKPTPYNTYTINGLPPTPIANPGRAALEAVAKPLQSDDLYFVADGTGGHVFAPTLKEHNENVRKWRAIEKSKSQ